MKRSILLLATMVVSGEGFSQSKLKGPRAKNATAVELASDALPITFYEAPNMLKGPKRKNQKVWDTVDTPTKTMYLRRNERGLKGPKAKNKKVWNE